MPPKLESNKAKSVSSVSDYVKKFDELKTVFDSLPDGVVAVLDKDMNIATANKSIAEILKLPIDKIVGKKIDDVFSARLPGLKEILLQTLKTGTNIRNYTIESRLESEDINSYLVSTAIIDELRDSDLAMLLILHDVSEMTRLRKNKLLMDRYDDIVGKSEKIKTIFALIDSIKSYDSSVLVVGETGTGKELIARAVHNASDRHLQPFIPVNCSALPDNLIESELFGHDKGAFTGAMAVRKGRFRLADGGSVFLDEIGTLNMETQAKLLRVLEDKIIEPLGSSERIPVNVRIISATNRNLAELIKNGQFREDLFYRLKVLQINLPPLRERSEDIALLVDHFISRLKKYYKKNIVGISPGALELLMSYQWPGNIRELQNAIEHAFVFAGGLLLEISDFPPEIRHSDANGAPPPPTGIDLSGEEESIKRALLAAKGNRDKAAGILDIHRTTLWRKMREFRIPDSFGQ